MVSLHNITMSHNLNDRPGAVLYEYRKLIRMRKIVDAHTLIAGDG